MTDPIDPHSVRSSAEFPNRVQLDAVDHAILRELTADGRLANNLLARRVGVAPSTCLARVRALVASGVVRGFRADLDLTLLGRTVTALIAVRVQPEARPRLQQIAHEVAQLHDVVAVHVVGGDSDLIVHVACTSTDGIRDLLATDLGTDIAWSNTSLVFETIPG